MSEYMDDVKRYAANADEKAVAGIVKHLGIALKSKDASLVSCSSKDELAAGARRSSVCPAQMPIWTR